MNRTYTPELAPEVLDRLDSYAARFRGDFNRPRQAQYSGVYLQGLILDGERKSIEPLSRKVTLPTGLEVKDLDQALQQFVGQSTWDEQAVWKRYRSVMAATFASPKGIFVIDDTSFPKQGKHSVGVQRQYSGPSARSSKAGGRPRKRSRLKEGTPRPVSLKDLAAKTPLRKVTWREGTKGKLSGRFAWLRVWPGGGWATGACAGAGPAWLLIEEQADGKIQYALSNLPARTSRIKAVRLPASPSASPVRAT